MTGSQAAAAPREAVSQPHAPPLPIVVLALGLGVLLVGGTTAGGYLLINETTPAAVTPSEVVSAAGAVAATGQPPADAFDWRTGLAATTCEAPCAGGLTCSTKPVKCTSGLACVPGTGAERFADHELWTLHLSAVREVDVAGQFVNPCESQKDFWVCRRGTPACVSQADACANAGKSTASIEVTGAELDRGGVTLEVHVGGPAAPPLAVTVPIRNLRRGGLCRGFVVDATGGAVAKVTYFVLPR